MPDSDRIVHQRFGLGATPESATFSTDPALALTDEMRRYQPLPEAWKTYLAQQPPLSQSMSDLRQMNQQASPQEKESMRHQLRRAVRDRYTDAVSTRAWVAQQTATPFMERLVHFWSNHFAVSVQKPLVTQLAGSFEAQAIRPHLLGPFSELLLAVEKHPAMLVYLDQQQSRGPGSEALQRQAQRHPEKQVGLNENLAREILELHTLGVNGGYSQQDVTELARALTGWTLPSAQQAASNEARYPGFAFNPRVHEPGPRSLLGKRYAAGGLPQAETMLRDLALAPATATHLATKLARHFAADQPPPALVSRLRDRYLQTGGDLSALYRLLAEAPECQSPLPAKFKTPWEWLISSARALNIDLSHVKVAQVMDQLGQAVWKPGSPAGYDDVADSWLASNALMRRVEYAQRLAALSRLTLTPAELARRVLGSSLSPDTLKLIERAESIQTGVVLLLVSPEFLRR